MSGPETASRAVFVSYASADKATADALTAYLEQRGIRCWIAPRDVAAGALYADAIVRAINEAPRLLLLLSRSSIASAHVSKELERGSSKGKQIMAVRLDDAPLTPAFEYFLSESQWVDVPAAGQDGAFAQLAEALDAPAGTRPLPVAPAPAARRTSPGLLVAVLAAVVALAGIAAWLVQGRAAHAPGATAAVAASDKSIAVLPFADMSEAHDQEYFADGMAEQILDLVAKIPSLKVIARTSSFQFKGKSEDVRDIGEKLGVATVLEGSVRKAGDRMRITAQLVRTSDGSQLWSEVYDRQASDVFRTQDEIADAVVSALRASLFGAPEKRAAPTANTEAYSLYLQGLSASQHFTAADSSKAREYLERATALDPNFAQAWAALAGVYGDLQVFGTRESFDSVNRRIGAAAHRALALDPKLADAHVALANMGFVDYDVVKMRDELRQASASEPDNINALQLSVFLAIAECRLADAERLARRRIERDPLSIEPYRGLGTALWFAGKNADAEATYRRMLAISPGAESMHYRLALVLLSEGKPQDALHELDAEPATGWAAIGRAMAYDALGNRAESERQIAVVANLGVGWEYQASEIYAHRHDRERAFEWLDRAWKTHDPGLFTYLKCDPLLVELRGDPRYAQMLSALKLTH